MANTNTTNKPVLTNAQGVQDQKVTSGGNNGAVSVPVTNPGQTVSTQSTGGNGYVSAAQKIAAADDPYAARMAAEDAERDAIQARIAADPTLGTKMTSEEMTQYYADVMADTLSGKTGGEVWSKGGYTTSKQAADIAQSQYGAEVTEGPIPGTGNKYGYYVSPTREEDPTNGGMGADYSRMTDEDYAAVGYEKQVYAENQTTYNQALAEYQTLTDKSSPRAIELQEIMNTAKANMAQANANAERIRLGYGYMGGADGSLYITAGSLGLSDKGGANTGTGTSAGTSSGSSGSDLTALLEQWKAAALEQSGGQIDYAVQQAITELERALEDAQPQFKEQAEAVAKDELQALDNSALYAEARGDKGGIGHSQYNEIQAAAAQNRLAVQQAQTQLSTDTARQIADLRAQGEFEKADKALEIAQTYLSQLISLEQWAAEFGLSQQQFEASLQQWQAEYDLAMQQFQVDTDLAYKQLAMSGDEQLASMGEAMLSSGIMPSAEQLSAMGMTERQATEYLTALQLESAVGNSGSSSKSGSSNSGTSKPTLTWAQTKAEIEGGNLNATVLAAYEYYMGEPYNASTDSSESSGSTAALSSAASAFKKQLSGMRSKSEMLSELDRAVTSGVITSDEDINALIDYIEELWVTK